MQALDLGSRRTAVLAKFMTVGFRHVNSEVTTKDLPSVAGLGKRLNLLKTQDSTQLALCGRLSTLGLCSLNHGDKHAEATEAKILARRTLVYFQFIHLRKYPGKTAVSIN